MVRKWKSQGPRGEKKTIWTKMAIWIKPQGLKWQFTLKKSNKFNKKRFKGIFASKAAYP
ncbi:hypothetical protein HanRHA438_Chr00c20g0852061 [Helianthus annuus]|nr:hypothetical protein HanRHA438_Chr00c20g0852061 [Helianthus annuus]